MGNKAIEMTGKVYGKWTVGERDGSIKAPSYHCKCKCGTERVVNGRSLRSGDSKSCGCGRLMDGKRASAHPLYYTWLCIKGGDMCMEWRDSFPTFAEDMGDKPSGYSIERIDESKGYYPDNCRWSTAYDKTLG